MNIPKKMSAYLVKEYGGPEVLRKEDIEVPNINEEEILIKMHATSISFGDVRVRGAIYPKGLALVGKLMMGFNGPKQPVLGVDFAGEVISIGSSVNKFKIGDNVFGIDGKDSGGYAEFKKINQSGPVALMPEGANYNEAASLIFGGTTAIQYLKFKACVKQGESILINGASGAVGSSAVQIAKSYGLEVVGVCSSKNIDLVRSLGASEVIDYKTELIEDIDKKFDYVMDAVGNLRFRDIKHLIKDGGKLLSVAGGGSVLAASIINNNIIAGPVEETTQDVETLADLFEVNSIKPVIDKIYKFDEIVEAHRYVEQGHKVGNVILEIDAD